MLGPKLEYLDMTVLLESLDLTALLEYYNYTYISKGVSVESIKTHLDPPLLSAVHVL